MLELKIALRYIFSKKTHNAVNVISLISVAGVAVATMAIVIVLSVFNGFERLAEQQLSVLNPTLKIVPTTGKAITNADSLAAEIQKIAPSSIAIPTITEQGLAIVGEQQTPVKLRGVDERWFNATNFDRTVIDGDAMLNDSVWGYANASVGIAVTLKAHPGAYEFLNIYVPRRMGRINPANPYSAFHSDSLIVASVFQTQHTATDQEVVIMPIDRLRTMLDYPTEATEIEVWTTDNADTESFAKKIEALAPDMIKAQNHVEQESHTFAMISIEKWITFLMLGFILVIASFNIISTLSLLVLEKQANLKIMKAMGATKKMITRVFTVEGWLISLGGGLMGIILGCALTLAQQYGGFIKLGGDASQMIINTYPVELRPSDLIIVIALVAALGLLTSGLTTIFVRRKNID